MNVSNCSSTENTPCRVWPFFGGIRRGWVGGGLRRLHFDLDLASLPVASRGAAQTRPTLGAAFCHGEVAVGAVEAALVVRLAEAARRATHALRPAHERLGRGPRRTREALDRPGARCELAFEASLTRAAVVVVESARRAR